MEDNGFPKYQYSVFTNDNRKGQYVVRSNNFEEFKTLLKEIETLDPVENKEPAVEDTAICTIHKVALKHFEKDGSEWWSHQMNDGKWCNGRPTEYNKEL